MIEISENLQLDESEIEWKFSRASGPGGQKVNKTASAVQLRFDISASQSLPRPVRQRLRRLAMNRVNQEGVLLIDVSEHRSQQANRDAAKARLVQLIARAVQPPKQRKPTRPSKAAKERRLEAKRRRAEKKRRRSFNPRQDW